jgi:predicted PurR-regulated permease PerM
MLWLLEDQMERPERVRSSPHHYSRVPPSLTIATVLCVAGALFTLVHFWPSLILASWVAALVTPRLERMAPTSNKRKRLVALVITGLVIVLLSVLALLAVSLIEAGLELVRTLMKTESGSAALRALVSNGHEHRIDLQHLKPEQVAQMVREYGAGAAVAIGAIFGQTTEAVVGAVVFIVATYFLLTCGDRAYAWLTEHAVMPPRILRRFATAYVETGRGLLIGMGLTALLQAAVASIGYVVLGVPRPAALGFLTFLAALVPTLGTALVWVPVAIALLASGRPGAAAVMTVGSRVGVNSGCPASLFSSQCWVALRVSVPGG